MSGRHVQATASRSCAGIQPHEGRAHRGEPVDPTLAQGNICGPLLGIGREQVSNVDRNVHQLHTGGEQCGRESVEFGVVDTGELKAVRRSETPCSCYR